ncbi:MAG: DUF4982 domain-containing protein [Bacteroidales bacterium]|nr:DUF4982 domain-containing protein [Bacteroidales bacterium]
MKQRTFLAILMLGFITQGLPGQGSERLFDQGWKFHRGGAQGAEAADFDDASWRNVDLPHDWSIEDLPGLASPFSADAVSQVSGGFTSGGTGWYRKTFETGAESEGKRVILQFDGVYMNCEVWVNGSSFGSHPYGYTSFWYDITDKLKTGGRNVVAVKVRNEGENSRWYAGSGIYRHVRIRICDPVHLAQWGTTVTTPVITPGSARVVVSNEIANKTGKPADLRLLTRVIDRAGREAARSESEIKADGDAVIKSELTVNKPELWSLDKPALYTLISELYSGVVLRDRRETVFGIRSISFDANKGFRLNGEALKLKGGCLHHDHGPLGAKSYDRAEERRAELLKAAGFNAVRCSHNPPAQAFLDACDRLGLLVIDEAFDMWQYAKNPADYSLYFSNWWKKDVESMIRRDRNHPSVILWSIGNEISGMDRPEVVETAAQLASFVRSADQTRPVIAAVNNLNAKKDPFFAALDIAGYNYGSGGDHLRENIFITDHERVPGRIMIQTESYPLEAFRSWMDVLDNEWLLGDFVWTAFDYIGEASIGWRGYWQKQDFFPWNLAYCGDIDICGWKRPQSFYRDALWKKDQLSLFVKPPMPSFPENISRMSWSKWHWYDAVDDWNWEGFEGKPLLVSAYSSCEEVELFLNGKSLGRKKCGRETEYMAEWQVPFTPGELKAVGYSGNIKVSESVLRTAGEVSSMKISADRTRIISNGQDLSYVTIELTDSRGTRNPKAGKLLRFEVSGPGTIAGVGNSDPVSLESYTLPQRRTWKGRALVILKSSRVPGDIKLKVSSEGLPVGEIVIESGGK